MLASDWVKKMFFTNSANIATNKIPPKTKQQINKYMNNQIVVHNQSVSDIETMAKAITKSGLFGIKSPEQAVALMLVAQSEGRHPASVASEFDIIQGRPALKSQAALARFQAAGGKIQWTSRGPSKCSAKFAHAQGGELEITWTMERANAAGLTGKATWRQYPDQMLSARVVAEGVRAVFPACLNGVYLAEEVQDFDSKPVRTPAPVVIKEATKVNATQVEYVQHSLRNDEEVACRSNERSVLVDPFKNAEVLKTFPELEDAPEIAWESGNWYDNIKAQIDPVADAATRFLSAKGQLAEGQSWTDLGEGAYRKRILEATDKFIAALEASK